MSRLFLALVVAFVVSPLARGQAKIEDDPWPRRDATVDPLPPGAVARLYSLPKRCSFIVHVAFSPDGSRLLMGSNLFLTCSGGWQETTCLWDTETWKLLRRHPWGDPSQSNVRVPSPAQSVYIAQDNGGRLGFFDAATHKLLAHLEGQEPKMLGISGIFSPTGRFFIAELYGRERGVVFAVPSGKLLRRLPAQSLGCAWAFTADDERVALFRGEDGLIDVYATATGELLRRLVPPPSHWRLGFTTNCTALAFSPDGKLLASWNGTDGDVHIWDLATGKECHRLPGKAQAPNEYYDLGLAWSPDGHMLAVGGMGGGHQIQLWEVASRKVRGELTGHRGVPGALAFSPDGRFLVSGSEDGTALIWDIWRQ
jgi:WD40 repeat protein